MLKLELKTSFFRIILFMQMKKLCYNDKLVFASDILQAALVGGGVPVNGMSPNAALLAAMASGQPTGAVAATHPHPHHPHPAGTQPGTPAHLAVSHQQQQAAALAAASLISSSPGAAGPGATPGGPGGAATSPHNMSSAAHQAATLQHLQQQLAAAASNGQQVS